MINEYNIERLTTMALAMRKRAYPPLLKGEVSDEHEGCVLIDERGIIHKGCTIIYKHSYLVIEPASVSIASMIASGAKKILALCMTDQNPSEDVLSRIREFSDADTQFYIVDRDGGYQQYQLMKGE